jgi:hypothetical protein
MAELKFPYTMHCPKCKAKLKISKPEMVGQRMACPACKKKIDVVTPDEDGHVPYEIGGVRVEKKTPEAEEEELEKLEEIQEQERKAKRKANIKWTVSVLFYLGLLGGTAWGFYEFVVKGYSERAAAKAKERENAPDLFGKTFSVD